MQFKVHISYGIVFILWSMCGILRSQDLTLIPELKKSLRTAGTDSLRAELLWQLGYNFSQSNPDSGIFYAKQSFELSKKINFIKGLGDSENIWGFSLTSAGEYDSAHAHYENAMKYFRQMNDPCNTTVVMGNWGWNYLNHHEDVKGLECFLEAEKLDRLCDSRGWKSTTYYNIGAAYNRMHQYDKALQYFDQAMAMDEERRDSAKLSISTLGKANAYRGMNNLDQAEVFYKKAIRLNEIMGNEYTLGFVYENLAQLLFDRGKQEEGIMHCRKALDIFKRMERTDDIIYESLLLGTMLQESNRSGEAEEVLVDLLPLTFIHKTPYERKEVYERLSHVYSDQGKSALAYQYLRKYVALKDSLNEEDQKATLAELTTRFETEKKDQQLEVERANRDRETERAERQTFQKYVFLAGAIVFALIALVLINRFQIKKRTAKELEEKNKIIEREKDRAERSERLKQQFLANMSHEIRTPMNAINGLSRLLLDKNHDNQTREYLEAIHHSGENMQVILNDILDLAKLEAGQFLIHPFVFDLRKEAEHVIRIFNARAASKGLFLRLDIDSKLPPVIKADGARLSQIWSNLISNAIKFTEIGGVEMKLSASAKNVLHVAVSDTGRGIPTDELPHIFESFVQIKAEGSQSTDGTGLGLTIARNLAQRMGGQLEVRSVQGKGSVFTFSVPYEEANSEDIVSNTVDVRGQSITKHIIVAEDNDYNFTVAEGTLRKYFPGVQIVRARDGQEVLEILQEDDYDLILMDVQMPILNGYEATRRIRSIGSTIPIIALTASVTQHELDLCFESGMDDFVLKPFKDGDFIAAINKAFQVDVKFSDIDSTKSDSAVFPEYAPALVMQFDEAADRRDWKGIRAASHAARPLLVRCGYHNLADDCIHFENTTEPDALNWQKAIVFIQDLKNKLQ